ncbi:nicotinamide nicotinic acid mononucleotide adenylyltransferase 1 [Brachionus plicatilis]|uniref:Nicotinamide-nucleotide adenylyltransferase n=1 Tax=Brachionus plicatilis TaxID=10195 RepID=A0A3M7PQT2_BRAPC|nr:nicotinamide nicotinic acid mononucleotide adenylyltransferase 1 [Brachionus plicatilis]
MAQKTPLVLLLCGSFNPVTNMHLRMFEIAKNYFNSSEKYDLLKGIISPVSDGYKKKGLLDALTRCKMVKLGLKNQDWIELSEWESTKSEWTPTLEVLNYHKKYAESLFGKNVQLMLLCGGDLVETFLIPNLWKADHMEEIFSNFGLAVINRMGSGPEKTIYENDFLYKHKNNIYLINDWILNDISSTKIRRAISRNESVRYLIPDEVNDFILKNNLYKN